MLFASKHKIRLYRAGQSEPFMTVEVDSQHIEMLDLHTVKSDTSVIKFGNDVFVAVDE